MAVNGSAPAAMAVSAMGKVRPAHPHRAKLQSERRARLNRFCDLLADGASVVRAAAAVGVSEVTGQSMLRQVRAELGPQAV